MSRPKKNKAVALKYNAQEDLAPIVIASGYGDVAKRIIEVAEFPGNPGVPGRQRCIAFMYAGGGKQYPAGTV